ncbi:hypothetical protein ACMBCN_01350 [Candidatus Liberibacter asiaticus]|nr:hypothetical protein [Candidatus Liberibacter asiaticus]
MEKFLKRNKLTRKENHLKRLQIIFFLNNSDKFFFFFLIFPFLGLPLFSLLNSKQS